MLVLPFPVDFGAFGMSGSPMRVAPGIATAIVFAALLTGGCTGTKEKPAPSVGEATLTEYRIGAGDKLQIFVWGNPGLSDTVPVRPDGRISIPLVEDIPVAGKTPTE